MAGFGLVLSLIFVPEVQQETDGSGIEKEKKKITLGYVLRVSNPARVFRLWLYPNILFSVRSEPLHIESMDVYGWVLTLSVHNLWSPGHIPLRPPLLRPYNLQPALQPNLRARKRPLLSRARRRLPSRQRTGRPSIRQNSPQIHSAPRVPTPTGSIEQWAIHALPYPPRGDARLRLDAAAGEGGYASADYCRICRWCWLDGEL